MINLKAFNNTVCSTDAENMSDYDMVTATLELNDIIAEVKELTESADTVAQIKAAITGREIDEGLLAYAGESIGQLAPAFVAGDSDDAVEQMEEGLKEFGKKVVDLVKRMVAAIVKFFKKIFPFLKKADEAMDDFIKKFDGQKVEWKSKDGKVIALSGDAEDALEITPEMIKEFLVYIDLIEDLADGLEKEEIKGPESFKDWKKIEEEAIDLQKSFADGDMDLPKDMIEKSKAKASDYVSVAKSLASVRADITSMEKAVKKLEKFANKPATDIRYNKDAFDKMDPVTACRLFVKVIQKSMSFVAWINSETLKALKQIKIKK